MSNIIDLDAIDPQPRTIKLGGEEFTVQPPKTTDIIRLGFYVGNLTDADKNDEAKVQTAVEDLTAHVYKCIPSIAGKALSKVQLETLVNIITDMAQPPEAKELDERGITTGDPSKKAPED